MPDYEFGTDIAEIEARERENIEATDWMGGGGSGSVGMPFSWQTRAAQFSPEWFNFAGSRFGDPNLTPFGYEQQRKAALERAMGTPFMWEGGKWITPNEFGQTPFSPEEFGDYRARFGGGLVDAPPLSRQRYLETVAQNFPGIDFNQFGFGTNYANQVRTPPPSFLSKVYKFAPNENLSSLAQRARAGVKDWLSGGPDAPRILTPREWEDMLPSEREGLLGFLDYIGIPEDDYMSMMQKQQQEVTRSFGISPNWRPAQQR